MVRFKINSIHINGFKTAENKAELILAETQTSTIYGKNGCGKTTLLYTINAVFDKNEYALKENGIDDIVLKCQCDGKDIVLEAKAEKKQEEIIGYDFIGFDDFQESSLFITTDRGLNNPVDREIRIEDVQDILKRLSKNRKDFSINLDSKMVDVYSFIEELNGLKDKADVESILQEKNLIIEKITMETVEKLFCRNVENLSFMLINSFSEAVVIALDMKKDADKRFKIEELDGMMKIYDEFKKLNERLIGVDKRVMPFLYKCENDLKQAIEEINQSGSKGVCQDYRFLAIQGFLNNIRHESDILAYFNVQEMFSKYIANKKLLMEDGTLKVQVKNGVHDLNQLSNGERQFLTFLIVLSVLGKDKSVIMIDEPGISLDTDWQEDFVSIIETLCPNSQIILTTHSPDVSLCDTNMICHLEID